MRSEAIIVRASMVAPVGTISQDALDSLSKSLTDGIRRPVVLKISQIPEIRWNSKASLE